MTAIIVTHPLYVLAKSSQSFDIKKSKRFTLADGWSLDGLNLERGWTDCLWTRKVILFERLLRNSLWCFVPTLRDACWQKHQLWGDMAACQDLRQTDCLRRKKNELTRREDVVINIKEQKRIKARIRNMRKWSSLFPVTKVTTQERKEEHSGKRHPKTTAEDCDIWILIGEGYLRPGVALVLWQQIQKGFGWPPESPESEPQLVAILETKTTVVFQILASWVGLNHPLRGFPSIGKPDFLNCEWAFGIGTERQVWGES